MARQVVRRYPCTEPLTGRWPLIPEKRVQVEQGDSLSNNDGDSYENVT